MFHSYSISTFFFMLFFGANKYLELIKKSFIDHKKTSNLFFFGHILSVDRRFFCRKFISGIASDQIAYKLWKIGDRFEIDDVKVMERCRK